jgi:hypothetical protein
MGGADCFVQGWNGQPLADPVTNNNHNGKMEIIGVTKKGGRRGAGN